MMEILMQLIAQSHLEKTCVFLFPMHKPYRNKHLYKKLKEFINN